MPWTLDTILRGAKDGSLARAEHRPFKEGVTLQMILCGSSEPHRLCLATGSGAFVQAGFVSGTRAANRGIL